ncbi:hypothetical protein [Acuticoccus kandeliae]|uniref:hypothetical protein n=1 Tax=Acuticoccus kandeliae TaxID=2073160 RepID=UPI000D3ED1F5|nr:hypothetical protein [Acuticoccus kandeliae]
MEDRIKQLERDVHEALERISHALRVIGDHVSETDSVAAQKIHHHTNLLTHNIDDLKARIGE